MRSENAILQSSILDPELRQGRYGLERRPMEHVRAGDAAVPEDPVGSFVRTAVCRHSRLALLFAPPRNTVLVACT